MSLKGQALRALVVQRLVVAADEIFALFERTFAEYQDELRSKLLQQQPRVVFHREDIQALTLGSQPIKINQEEDPPLKPLPFITVKSEENIDKCTFLQQDPAEEMTQEFVVDQREGEKPGCSVDLDLDDSEQNNSWSGTDNSSDWETMDKRTLLYERQELKAGHSKISAAENVIGNDRPQCSTVFQVQKPFSCSMCPRGFNSKGHLNEHMRSHTGEKPYSCSGCGMKFRLKTTRERHFQNMHNAQKPYTCPVCHKGFVERYYYVIHMRIHTGERPFSCSVCGKSYRERKLLTKHIILTKHSQAQCQDPE